MNARLTAGCGIAAAVLFIVGNSLWAWEQPESNAPADELIAFYADNADGIIWGGGMSLLSIALILVFAAGLRRLLADAEGNDGLATAAFGGAVLLAGAGLVAETLNMVGGLRADEGDLSPELADSLFEISYALGFQGAGVGMGLFAICVAASALRSRAVLPPWLAAITILAGLLLLSPLVEIGFYVAFPLLIVISLVLLRAPPGIPDATG